jgi:ectoine hydroxylase-related dioxygenase (phytanoyl-CoA dioxygenase family)
MKNYVKDYQRDGYLAPIPVVSQAEAAQYRQQLESVEAEMGSMHYQFKAHTVMSSPQQLATHPALLDVVEQLLGPDILLYSTSFIIKEPHTKTHVSWHQDLTYWGLSSEEQVSAWIALSPATVKSGCMMMIPGSHTQGQREHTTGDDADNVLLGSQRIEGVDTSRARPLVLQPGEASLHHGWTMHSSQPNRSDDRRIGLNIQYIVPSVRQLKAGHDSALLVRGEDRYQHFEADVPATLVFDRDAWQHQQQVAAKLAEIQGNTN